MNRQADRREAGMPSASVQGCIYSVSAIYSFIVSLV